MGSNTTLSGNDLKCGFHLLLNGGSTKQERSGKRVVLLHGKFSSMGPPCVRPSLSMMDFICVSQVGSSPATCGLRQQQSCAICTGMMYSSLIGRLVAIPATLS